MYKKIFSVTVLLAFPNEDAFLFLMNIVFITFDVATAERRIIKPPALSNRGRKVGDPRSENRTEGGRQLPAACPFQDPVPLFKGADHGIPVRQLNAAREDSVRVPREAARCVC